MSLRMLGSTPKERTSFGIALRKPERCMSRAMIPALARKGNDGRHAERTSPYRSHQSALSSTPLRRDGKTQQNSLPMKKAVKKFESPLGMRNRHGESFFRLSLEDQATS